MAESSRAKVKELLGRHSELEQSETKAQAALVTILSLTQITELKLLLDIGRQGHRFYDFVLTLLVACVSLEIFIGVIIIYIGNLHYYQTIDRQNGDTTLSSRCYDVIRYVAQSCRLGVCKRSGSAYETVHEPEPGAPPTPHVAQSPMGDGSTPTVPRVPTWAHPDSFDLRDLYRFRGIAADGGLMELTRVRLADAEVKIIRAGNYVKTLEEATKKSPGSAELEAELGRAREELSSALRERQECEAEQKLVEVRQRQGVLMREGEEDHRERLIYRRVSFWQHMATYLLYFVMLMNVFITTFGISGGGGPAVHHVFTGHVISSGWSTPLNTKVTTPPSTVGFSVTFVNMSNSYTREPGS